MADIYDEMMETSQRIAASFPPPRFYDWCAVELNNSRAIYCQNEFVTRCRTIVSTELTHNPSHRLDHAEKVAIEAGALARAEGERTSLKESATREAAMLAQVAGLLHDMRRGERDHARSSSLAAEAMLCDLDMPQEHRQYIVQAIANHEAFVEPRTIESTIGGLISNVLYDADKFRWGPDNFTVTLWEMLRFSHASVIDLIHRFPDGLAGIARIKGTFRSTTGRIYGPEFIDLGLAIGDKLYQFLRQRFAEDLE
jgi:hypothetical protein